MKKVGKIWLALVAMVMVVACLFSLAACGDDSWGVKLHSPSNDASHWSAYTVDSYVAEDITTKEIGYQLNGMDDRGEGGKFYGNLILYKDGFARFYVATNKTAYYGYWLLEDEEIVLYQKYIVHPMMTTEFVYSTSIVADGGKLAGSATMSLGSYGGGAVPVESDGTIRYTTDAEFDTYVEGLKG